MKTFAILALSLSFISAANAQSIGTGTPAFGSFDFSQMDTVNLQNLNYLINIPIVSTPGRGMPFDANVAYNSITWVPSGTAPNTWKSNGGWPSFAGPTTVSPIGVSGFNHSTYTCPTGGGNVSIYNGYYYTDPLGTTHGFPTIVYTTTSSSCPNSRILTGYAGDASGYYIDITAGPTSPSVYSPDGTKVVLTTTTYDATDSNGNQIARTYSGSGPAQWSDTLGQVALKITTTATTATFAYPDSHGTLQPVTFTLQSLSIATKFACSGVAEFTGTMNLPVSISLPNGTQYTIAYEHTPGSTTTYTGRIQTLTLPTGGTITYSYTGSNDGVNCADGTVLGMTRSVYDGSNTAVWTYSRAVNTPTTGETTTTVTEPVMPYETTPNHDVAIFSGLSEISHKTYQGNVTGTPLRTVNSTWNTTTGTPLTRITILNDGSTQNEVETNYDTGGIGQLLTVKEHDWGSGAPGAISRATTNTYLTGNSPSGTSYASVNLIHKVTRTTIADSTGTLHYRVDTAYDGNSFTGGNCITGAANHDDTDYPCSNLTRGNPTQATIYTNAAAGSGAIGKASTYDSLGNLRTAQPDCCQLVAYAYSSITQYAFPDSTTTGASGGTQLTQSNTYFLPSGQLATETDPNRQVTSYTYDSSRRLTTVLRPDTTQITYAYNDTARSITASTPTMGPEERLDITYLDKLGRPYLDQTQDNGGATYSNVQKYYDPMGRPYETSSPYLSGTVYKTETTMDALGQPVAVIAPDSATTSYSRSANSTTVTDPAGNQRKFVADGLGRITTVDEPILTGSHSLTQATSYTYSVLDKVSAISQGAQSRTYTYDDAGRNTGAATPEAGSVSYQFNSFDLPSQRTDARGVVTHYMYDNLNRLVGRAYTIPGGSGVSAMPNICTPSIGGSANVCSYYDQGGATANALGRLTSMTDPTGSETYTYDSSMGRVIALQKVIGTTTYTIDYTYNLAGEVVNTTYPSARLVVDSYDNIGRLCGVTGATPPSSCGSASTTYASSIQYNSAFQLTNASYGNGVSATFGFSASRLDLRSVLYASGAQTLYSTNYFYATDATNCPSAPSFDNGQIRCIVDNVDFGRNVTYTYDVLRRLSTAATNGSANYPQWAMSWTYDIYGNRSAQTVTAGSAPSSLVGFNPSTNRINTSGYAYDAAGNITNDGQNTLTYDGENRVVASSGGAGSGSYSYDGNGLRVQKTSGSTTTTYIFSSSKVVAEYTNGAPPSSPTNEYVYLGASLLATVSSGAQSFYALDHLSVRATMDGSGNLIGQQGHYPYGEIWYSQNTTTKWKFTNYERDPESGNDYALSRFNVNRLGRFATTDPLAGPSTDPQRLNEYLYSRNDPINLIDPSGAALLPFDYTPGDSGSDDDWDPSNTVVNDPNDNLPEVPGIHIDVYPPIPIPPFVQPPPQDPVMANASDFSNDGSNSFLPSGPPAKQSWAWTFTKSFFTFAGGPGNVPTCTGQALLHIGETLNPFTPGVSTATEAAAPVAQAVALNRGVAQTGAAVDAYIATKGLTVPLRSSVVRGMIQEGAEGAVDAGSKANLAVQTLAVDYAAIKSAITTSEEARNGQCAAALPIF